MNPKISVIVPVYNVEKYLRRCIDSILSQTFSDFELLLIDDGSKDKSVYLIEASKKAKLVRVPVKGYGAALHWGIMHAKGEYIFFADADLSYDFMELKKFLIFIGVFAST